MSKKRALCPEPYALTISYTLTARETAFTNGKTIFSTTPTLQHINMPKKELDPQTRSRLCELRSIGWSYRKIHSRYPQIPLSTIKTTVYREHTRDNNTTRSRTGHPRRLTEEHRDRLCELVESNPHIKMDDILKEMGHIVKKRTIQNALKEMGKTRRPALSTNRMQKPVAGSQGEGEGAVQPYVSG